MDISSEGLEVAFLDQKEPKLQLFEVDDHGDAGNDDLSHHHLQNFKQS